MITSWKCYSQDLHSDLQSPEPVPLPTKPTGHPLASHQPRKTGWETEAQRGSLISHSHTTGRAWIHSFNLCRL